MSDEILAKIEQYKAALSQEPKSKQFLQLCAAYMQLGQLDDALEVALKGGWESPQFPDAFVAVGNVYYKRNVPRKAEEAFFKALSLDQMCIPAYKGLARIYKDSGDNDKASDVLTKAIMLDPGDQSLQQMIESLSPARAGMASIEPQSVVDQEHAMGQSSDGMKPITTATIADIYIEQGLYDKALDVYRELLTENPHDVSVQQKISELEALVQGGGATAGSPDVKTVPVAEAQPVSAPEIVHVEDPSDVSAGTEGAIEKLSRWLEDIQARRNRV